MNYVLAYVPYFHEPFMFHLSLFECLFQNNVYEDGRLVESAVELFCLLKRQDNMSHLEQHFHLKDENARQN